MKAQLANVDIDSIGDRDISDDDQLVFDPPCVRTRYASTEYRTLKDNNQLVYDAEHQLEIWCVAKNLTNKEQQREDSKALAGQVLPIVAGARVALSDGSTTDPLRLMGIAPVGTDENGTVYVIVLAMPGIAQFPGTNS